MHPHFQLPAVLSVIALASLLAACGGGDTDVTSSSTAAAEGTATILRGGTPTPTPTPTPPPVVVASPLPTTAPAPDILVRESFGLGPDVLRPAGGKGDLRATYLHTTIGGFWVEWPGSKNTAWMTPDGNQTWKFCGTNPSPYELPSPLQGDAANGFVNAGCAASEWFDLPVTQHPTALLPFTPPATAWAVSMEGYPAVVDGAYVAIGLTSSPSTMSNFETVGDVWLGLRKQQVMVNGALVYELRLNGKTGALLATGVVDDLTWNQMVISYDPVGQVMSASVNGLSLGHYPVKLAPKYAGFEGVGIMDNFVIRKVNAAVL
jgi:hypothetical protein